MTQRASQADIQLQGHHVTQYLSNMMQRDDAIMQNFKICRDTVMDAVQLYAEEKDEALLGKLRDQFVNLIETEHQVQQHKGALQQLWGSYQPSLDKTDFGGTVQEHLQQVQAGDRFSAGADPDLKMFDEVAGNEAQEQEMGDDDDIIVDSNVSKNEKCPYTLVPLADLQDPVEDQAGFIYEREAIVKALQRAQREDRFNWIECPLPGVSHKIMMQHLKSVNKKRLQLMVRLRQQQQQREGGTQAANRVVLD